MTIAKILIVDDETIMRESLAGWLERDGHAVQTARSGEEALRKCKENRFDILLLDIKMEGMSGLEVLRRVKESDADVAVVMITAYGSIATAIEAMKNGAFDYMLKPVDPNELGVLIEKIIRHQQQARENLYLKEQFKERTRFENMIGQSKPMQKVFDLICDVAPADSTVLITGETGTGKGLAAKAIHSHSRSLEKGHVYMDLLLDKLSKRGKNVMNTFTRVLCLILFAFLGYNLFNVGARFYASGEVSATIKIPFYPVAMASQSAVFLNAACSSLIS